MKTPILMLLFAGMILIRGENLEAQSLKKQSKQEGDAEWPAYGHDGGGSRYAPLKTINEANVKKLAVAWIYRTGELETYTGTPAIKKAAFEATPIMVDRTLFFSTPSCRVIALDAITGIRKWVFDPKVDLNADLSEITSRGVSVWPAHEQAGMNLQQKRIFLGTIDGRLIALNAKTGKLIDDFGDHGAIDLRAGLGDEISVTSPPAIIGNLVIVGSSIGDNQRFDYPRGTVRAYDAITGKLKWSWEPIPQNPGDKAWGTWIGPKAHKTGAANAWSIISVDPKRDLVFIPSSSPSPDYYGGERRGQNLYANSIIVLHASTGKMAWHFQVVHHDLWDYDIAAQPMLIEVTRNNKKVPAVAIGTKMGHIFLFNRENGEPLFPIEERQVPASTVAGEEAWKTQPFPVLPAPLGLQRLSVKDAWGIDPAGKKEAEKTLSRYRNEGVFTPPSFEGTLETPSNVGGIHWGGMCFDPLRGLLVTNVNRIAAIIRILPREKREQLEKEQPELLEAETGKQKGTLYIMKRYYPLVQDPAGNVIYQIAPPWGTLDAINMNTGARKWEVPLGYALDPKKFRGSENWGSINLGGAIVTAGNLVFVAASKDDHLRAFNTETGALLWEFLLPAGGQATPMTYRIKGKQYVVIAAGGHGKLGTRQGDYVFSFALPEH